MVEEETRVDRRPGGVRVPDNQGERAKGVYDHRIDGDLDPGVLTHYPDRICGSAAHHNIAEQG